MFFCHGVNVVTGGSLWGLRNKLAIVISLIYSEAMMWKGMIYY